MKLLSKCLIVSWILLLSACVTINVYFPAAAAERAADEFIRDVLGPDAGVDVSWTARPLQQVAAVPIGLRLLDSLVPAAHAQEADIDIHTPQIQAIKSRMQRRQSAQLAKYFDAGAIGFTQSGLVKVRDRSAVSLKERRSLESMVAEENRDRSAVYKEIAVANGHPDWEARIRATFAARWIANAKAGWYYENSQGAWLQK